MWQYSILLCEPPLASTTSCCSIARPVRKRPAKRLHRGTLEHLAGNERRIAKAIPNVKLLHGNNENQGDRGSTDHGLEPNGGTS